MKRQGIGIGSASLVLIFTVLCLAIFALISYTAAANDLALAKAEAEMVAGYYTADTEAEMLAAMLLAETSEISETTSRIEEFTCEISDEKELYVKIHITQNEDGENSYSILNWQARDKYEWIPDLNLPVWTGD